MRKYIRHTLGANRTWTTVFVLCTHLTVQQGRLQHFSINCLSTQPNVTGTPAQTYRVVKRWVIKSHGPKRNGTGWCSCRLNDALWQTWFLLYAATVKFRFPFSRRYSPRSCAYSLLMPGLVQLSLKKVFFSRKLCKFRLLASLHTALLFIRISVQLHAVIKGTMRDITRATGQKLFLLYSNLLLFFIYALCYQLPSNFHK